MTQQEKDNLLSKYLEAMQKEDFAAALWCKVKAKSEGVEVEMNKLFGSVDLLTAVFGTNEHPSFHPTVKQKRKKLINELKDEKLKIKLRKKFETKERRLNESKTNE